MTAIASTLDCRMLCASVCAYSIDQNGKFDKNDSQPYYDAVGWTNTPVPFVSGLLNIDAVLVGTIQAAGPLKTPAVVIAFRGTIPPTWPPTPQEFLDWLNDFDAAPKVVPGIFGQVHGDFWDSLMGLWPKLWAEAQKQMKAGGQNLPLYITGHSKGGAMASLAAAQANNNARVKPAAVYTFASPMCGDADWAFGYGLMGIPDLRWEYTDDIVPHVPPSPVIADLFEGLPWIGPYFKKIAKWDYTSVGTLRFIDWAGKVEGQSLSLEWRRFMSLFELFGELKFGQIAADHMSKCGGGYMTYVCPTGVCPIKADDAEPLADIPGESAFQRWRRERLRQIGG